MCSDRVTILATISRRSFSWNSWINAGESPTLPKVVKHELIGLIILKEYILGSFKTFHNSEVRKQTLTLTCENFDLSWNLQLDQCKVSV